MKQNFNSNQLRSDDYINRISTYYDQLNEVGRRIADFLIGNKSVLNEKITIGELAKMTGSSPSSIVRFCKTLGFDGFAEFKFFVQKGLFAQASEGVELNYSDDIAEIKQKVADTDKNAINESILMTDNRSLENAVEKLASARRILFCAQGSAFGIAHSSANMFMSIGKEAIAAADPLTHLRIAGFMDKRDAVVGITNCGHIKDVVDTLMVAQKHGVPTICITGIVDSLVTKYADTILYTSPHSRIKALDLPTTNICQTITIHILLIGVMLRLKGKNTGITEEMNNFAQLKRYSLSTDHIDITRVECKK